MEFADHILVALFVVVYPLAGIAGFRRLLQRLANGYTVDRMSIYRATMIGHWCLLFLALVCWAMAGRPWSALGLHWIGGWRMLAGALVVLAVVIFLLLQLCALARANETSIARLRGRFGHLAAVVPRSAGELRRFYSVSLTAGIAEEVLWRGFLIWYLAQAMPMFAAALLATLAFGLAHAYQGWRQLPAITAVGALLAALYILTGTLWASIVLHFAIDALQGRLGFAIDRRHRQMTAMAVRA